MAKVLDGTDLILSIWGKAFGFSENCKISTSAETGERVTKEATAGKWKEKYVKSYSETVTVDNFTLVENEDGDMPSYDDLRDMMLAGESIELSYSLREGSTREGKTAGGYKGNFIITSLELNGQAGDDSKNSATFENSGPVNKVGDGLNTAGSGNA